MTKCPTYCSSYQDLWKTEKYQLHTPTDYYSGSFSVLAKDLEDTSTILQITSKYTEELRGCFYLTQIFPELFALNIRTMGTLSQHLFEIFS